MCHAELTFEDLDSNTNNLTLGDANLTLAGANIVFSSKLLTPNRRYKMSVSASNLGSPTLSIKLISALLLLK